MYALNKVVGYLISPAGFGMALVSAAVLARVFGRRRLVGWAVLLALANFWFWASPATYRWLASGLESRFPVVTVEETPQANAIVVLGGGMGSNTNFYPYGEMWISADRVWHGARLYKAGKAPQVFVTGGNELSSKGLLMDFGVPTNAMVFVDARNTEEEARAIAQQVKVKGPGLQRNGRILLVTSAWHMRRAKLMFEKYAPGLEVIPAATDYEALVRCGWKVDFGWADLIPSPEMMFYSSYCFKEIIGYWGYRLFR